MNGIYDLLMKAIGSSGMGGAEAGGAAGAAPMGAMERLKALFGGGAPTPPAQPASQAPGSAVKSDALKDYFDKMEQKNRTQSGLDFYQNLMGTNPNQQTPKVPVSPVYVGTQMPRFNMWQPGMLNNF